MIATMAMLVGACTSDIPEYVGTNVNMYQASTQVNPKLESFDYTINFSLDNLSSAQDEDISEFGINIKLGDKTETVIFLKNTKVCELNGNNVTYSYTFKDLKYNESYQYEYSYIYRSDLGVVNFESDVYSGYIYKDRFSTLITVTAGTPYDVGLTYATIPVQLNLFDNCVKKVGVEYWYSDEYNSTKKVEYIENLKDKVSNITISCQRTDKITSYRCYAEDESGNVVYSKTSTLNFPAVDEGLAVDLGLSVKWAPFNVGSRKENVQKWYYYQGKEYLNQSSICGNSDCDIVMMYWGNKWRTPNKAQIEELIEKCTWEKVINKTHNGYKVIGPNGNSIFIPSGGYYDDYVRNKQDAIIISGSYHSSYAAYGILNGQLFTSGYTHSYAYPIRAILPN